MSRSTSPSEPQRTPDEAPARPRGAPTSEPSSRADRRPRTSHDLGADPLCEVQTVDLSRVRKVLAARSEQSEVEQLAEIFQVLASPTRLRLVEALTRGEMCVCDLAAVTGVSQSAVSHHLRVMRALRLVRYRKESRMAYYRLDDDHIEVLFRTGMDHVRE